MLRSQSRTDWRCTSVGWAVSTGLTRARANQAASASRPTPASAMRSSAWAKVPGPPASSRCASSAMLSSIEK